MQPPDRSFCFGLTRIGSLTWASALVSRMVNRALRAALAGVAVRYDRKAF